LQNSLRARNSASLVCSIWIKTEEPEMLALRERWTSLNLIEIVLRIIKSFWVNQPIKSAIP